MAQHSYGACWHTFQCASPSHAPPHKHCREDKCSLHASCPVIRGEKWTATKWCVRNGLSLLSAAAPRQLVGSPSAPATPHFSTRACVVRSVPLIAAAAGPPASRRLHTQAFPHPPPRWPNECEDRDKECPKVLWGCGLRAHEEATPLQRPHAASTLWAWSVCSDPLLSLFACHGMEAVVAERVVFFPPALIILPPSFFPLSASP